MRTKIFANGIELKHIPVTQNETGVYYWNGSTYHRPLLADFNSAKLPVGFKKYTNGSHTKYLYQKPIDFALAAGVNLTFNKDVKVIFSSPKDGSYTVAEVDGIKFYLVHTYYHKTAGSIVRAGNVVCKIAPQSVTGFAPHLHIFAKQGATYLAVRDTLLESDVAKDKNAEFRIDEWIRHDYGTNGKPGFKAKQGAVGVITTNAYYKDSFEWRYIKFLDSPDKHTEGWVAVDNRLQRTTRQMTKWDATMPLPPAPPEPPCEEKVQELKTTNLALENSIKNKNVIIAELRAKLAEYERFSALIGMLKTMFPSKEE